MSFNPPRRAYCDIAATVLLTASACGAFWLLIFSVCQFVEAL